MRKIVFVCIVVTSLSFIGCSGENNVKKSGIFGEKVVKYKMKKGGFEPSGVTKKGDKIYIVSDNGKAAIFKNGKIKYFKLKNKGDYEGITTDGKSFYIVSEKKASIEKFSENFEFLKEYKIDKKFNGKRVLKKRGNGLEGIAFLYEDKEGKRFVVANQSYKNKGKGKSALLFVAIKGEKVRTYGYAPMNIVDISGLYYDKKRDLLYVLSDTNDKVFVYKLKDMKLLKEFGVPGKEQEGIFKDKNYLYIADDNGKFFQIKVF